MRSSEQAFCDMDEAEIEIGEILKKYNLTLTPLYDAGISLELGAYDEHPNGDTSVKTRECNFD